MQELIAGDWVEAKTERFHVRGRVVAKFSTQVNVRVFWIGPRSRSVRYNDVVAVYEAAQLKAPQIVWASTKKRPKKLGHRKTKLLRAVRRA